MTDNQLWIVHATISNVSGCFMIYSIARMVVDRALPPKQVIREKDQ